MSMIRFWIFDFSVRILSHSKAVKHIHWQAWHDGWEQRTLVGDVPACPDEYYPGLDANDVI